jgi:hypothetical protein
MDAVTTAILADAAFDAVGEATRFSTQRYREMVEQLRQTGELAFVTVGPAGGQSTRSEPPTLRLGPQPIPALRPTRRSYRWLERGATP